MPAKKAADTKVLIADAQRLFSAALAVALGRKPGLVVLPERPAAPQEAVEAALRLRPDVLLCDFWLDGLATTRAVIEALPDCKVILVSWMTSPEHISSALTAGAVGFLTQSVGVEDVAKAIKAAGKKGRPLVFAGELAKLHETITERSKQTAEWGKKFDKLTPRQQQILRLLGTGKLIQEIAKELGIAPVTVKWHIGRILAETGTRSQAEVLAVARYAGVVRT